jgi:hypothetical protein
VYHFNKYGFSEAFDGRVKDVQKYINNFTLFELKLVHLLNFVEEMPYKDRKLKFPHKEFIGQSFVQSRH